MAKVFVCDRCGEELSKGEELFQIEIGRADVPQDVDTIEITYEEDDVFDLCQKCFERFQHWFYEEK